MGSNDITGVELDELSWGINDDKHHGFQCCPKRVTGVLYRNGMKSIKVVVFFRDCKCNPDVQRMCENALRQFYSTGISLPYEGVDIHSYDGQCQFRQPKTRNAIEEQRDITYICECYCKGRKRTSFVYK